MRKKISKKIFENTLPISMVSHKKMKKRILPLGARISVQEMNGDITIGTYGGITELLDDEWMILEDPTDDMISTLYIVCNNITCIAICK